MKYFFHTFGCRVNQYETQVLRERLVAGDSEAVEDWQTADVCVVNTCTVTQEADEDALRLIRRIARRNPAARLVVTGCLASRSPETVLEAAPAALVAGNESKEVLPALLGCSAAPAYAGITAFHDRSRAFVKVQDGCNMTCTYCIIPSVRPRLECKPWAGLEAEVRGLVGSGVKEVVVCGVRLGRYLSEDGQGRRVDFVGMLERLLELPGDFRVRLSSFEVTDLTDRLIVLAARSGGRLCRHFHVPLQSGSDAVLRRMERWYASGFYLRRIEALRARLPDAGVFADVMVGFPGERQDDFQETNDLIRKAELSGLHVFRYSRRAGTPAARMKDQVPEAVKTARAGGLRALDKDLRRRFAEAAVGDERRVLMESPTEGLTDQFLRVRFGADVPAGFVQAQITSAQDGLACARRA